MKDSVTAVLTAVAVTKFFLSFEFLRCKMTFDFRLPTTEF